MKQKNASSRLRTAAVIDALVAIHPATGQSLPACIGRVFYLPVYSHIYHGDPDHQDQSSLPLAPRRLDSTRAKSSTA